MCLRFVTITSIIFENEDADINAKCEWAFTNQNRSPVELDDYADGLKHVALPLYSYAQCVERYGDPITKRMLCAGGTTEDTCEVGAQAGGALTH